MRWQGTDETYPNYQIAMLLYAPHFAAAAQRSAAERFMIGYLRGVRDYNDAFVKQQGRDAVVDILINTRRSRTARSTMRWCPRACGPTAG